MKKAIALLLAASMTLSLAACGGGGGGSSTPDSSSGDSEVVELTYWYSWTDKIQENNINLVNQFNETVGKEKGSTSLPNTRAPMWTCTRSFKPLISPAQCPMSPSWKSHPSRPLPKTAFWSP